MKMKGIMLNGINELLWRLVGLEAENCDRPRKARKCQHEGNEINDVPGSGRRKQGKYVGFMCEWRGVVWLREERGRGLGLDLGVSQSLVMKEMIIMNNEYLGGQISGAVKTYLKMVLVQKCNTH